MSNAGSSAKGYITGEFTADANGNWQIFPMKQVGSSSTYTFTTHLSQGQTGAYYYLSDSVGQLARLYQRIYKGNGMIDYIRHLQQKKNR